MGTRGALHESQVPVPQPVAKHWVSLLPKPSDADGCTLQTLQGLGSTCKGPAEPSQRNAPRWTLSSMSLWTPRKEVPTEGMGAPGGNQGSRGSCPAAVDKPRIQGHCPVGWAHLRWPVTAGLRLWGEQHPSFTPRCPQVDTAGCLGLVTLSQGGRSRTHRARGLRALSDKRERACTALLSRCAANEQRRPRRQTQAGSWRRSAARQGPLGAARPVGGLTPPPPQSEPSAPSF